MRKSTIYLSLMAPGIVILVLLLVLAPVHGWRSFDATRAEARVLVRELGLTDLCLFTEARYTRHLSQADIHAAFQDYPTSLEHFPSGSLVLPPDLLRNLQARGGNDYGLD
jgi:hypothetical protein